MSKYCRIRFELNRNQWDTVLEPKVFSDFDFGGYLTEIGLAGVVALRLQKNIDWDGPGMKVPGMPEADRFIHPPERRRY